MGHKTETSFSYKRAINELNPDHLRVSMWPPTTSRILEPPDCLPGLFWGHFKRQNAASNVSDHVCSVWDCENFSKLGKSWKQKPFWPRLRKKGAGARRLPLLFSHQPMRGQHVCLSVPLNKKKLYTCCPFPVIWTRTSTHNEDSLKWL